MKKENKQDQVATATFTELNKITQVLTQRREESHNGLVTIDQKLNGLEADVLTRANTLIQNHSGEEWKEYGKSRVRHSRPKIPYQLEETKLEEPSDSSYSLPPGLSPGGDTRKMGFKQKGEHDQIQEEDSDSVTTWGKTLKM